MISIKHKALPPWQLQSINGAKVPKVEDFIGQPFLILFFYLDCPGCIGRAVPFANRMKVEYGDQFNVIGIHSQLEGPEYSNETLIEEMKKLHVRFPVFKDLELRATFEKYGALGTPHWFLVNEEGRVVKSIFGSDPNRGLLRLDLSIKELMNEEGE